MSSLRSEYPLETVLVPNGAMSHEGFRVWAMSDGFPQSGRISYLDGDIYVDLSREEISKHNKIKTAITAELGLFAREHDVGEAFCDGTLVSNLEAGVSNEPDVTFVTWDAFRTGRVRLVPRPGDDEETGHMELQGSPNLVVEIVSDSSVTKDKKRLRELYCRAGIPEYWLIDPRGAEVQFDVLVRDAGGYVEQPEDAGGFRRSDVLARNVRLTRSRNQIGHWGYRLEISDLK